ncbi:rod shape-determining protein [Desulfurispirillum indicum]|uniref:Cell shape-determining protein MreB n=1 Tax=Desulfurispirillum indicum (strain ATCC BAA-1389 / DSM 22839 / S5) TaxID=653733 RepID=E6W0W4_DESIS|nr:rod shape-determining protein [Desulfurispirillum indicum]ADU65296.1 cell shape determining protein, MreB/Mrl family [Desulfurispirillum indicum S5]UCZ57193.1 rod shape-determining protein [Desulfurispirillum indicum]
MLRLFKRFFSKDIAMDLGTANSLIFCRGKGIVLNEPSVVAIDRYTGEVIAWGMEAKRMLGRTNKEIEVIRPLKDGVIANFDVTNKMMRKMLEAAYNRAHLVHPRMIICVPAGITSVEKRAVIDAAEQSGARECFLIEEPMAAAIGAGLPISEPTGSMIVDIGGGTTEVAVISLGGIAYSESMRVAGDEINEAIIRYLRLEHNLLVGENLAEQVKIAIGSAYPLEQELTYTVKGRSVETGIPASKEISSQEIREAIREPVDVIMKTVFRALEKTSPELISDVADYGIVITGGGALLRNLNVYVEKVTGVNVIIADDPLTSVVRGTGWALEDMATYRDVFVN